MIVSKGDETLNEYQKKKEKLEFIVNCFMENLG